jgi:hypothetical protein
MRQTDQASNLVGTAALDHVDACPGMSSSTDQKQLRPAH